MECSNCHAVVVDGAKFCPVCGTRVSLVPSVRGSLGAPDAAVRPASSPQATVFSMRDSVAFKTIAQASLAAMNVQRAQESVEGATERLASSRRAALIMTAAGMALGVATAVVVALNARGSLSEVASSSALLGGLAVLLAWGVVGFALARHRGVFLVALGGRLLVVAAAAIVVLFCVTGPLLYAWAWVRTWRDARALAAAQEAYRRAVAVIM